MKILLKTKLPQTENTELRLIKDGKLYCVVLYYNLLLSSTPLTPPKSSHQNALGFFNGFLKGWTMA